MKEYDFTKPENEHLIHRAIDFFIQRDTLRHYPNLSAEVAKKFILNYCMIYKEFLRKKKHIKIIPFFIKEIENALKNPNLVNDPSRARVTCKKGCNHCCHMGVCITHEEAVLLYRKYPQKIKNNVARLELQSKLKNSNDWFRVPKQDRACIFLEEGLCSVYSDRPMACRQHYTVGEPSKCDLDHNTQEPIGAWRPFIFAAIAMTLTLMGRSDYLAVKLLEVNK
jgi:Fe-S-cluster containining protein